MAAALIGARPIRRCELVRCIAKNAAFLITDQFIVMATWGAARPSLLRRLLLVRAMH